MGTEPAAKMASWIIDFLDADMDCVNMRGWTALHLAYEHDNNRMIRMLEYKGADTSIRDAIGFVVCSRSLRLETSHHIGRPCVCFCAGTPLSYEDFYDLL